MSKAQFDEAVKIVQTKEASGGFKISPTTEEQLVFYKLYKQATVGDVDIQRPSGFLDFQGKAKWDAWSEVKGMSKEEAMQSYVKTLKEILGKSDHEQAKAYIAQIDAAA